MKGKWLNENLWKAGIPAYPNVSHTPYPETPRLSLTYKWSRYFSSPSLPLLCPDIPSLIHTHSHPDFGLGGIIWVLLWKSFTTPDTTQWHFVLGLWWWGDRKRGLCVSRNPLLKRSQAPFPSRTSVMTGSYFLSVNDNRNYPEIIHQNM